MFAFFYLTENIFDAIKKFHYSNGENGGESALFSSIDKLHYMYWETTLIETVLKEDPLYIGIFQLKLCQNKSSTIRFFTEDNMDSFTNKVLWLIYNEFPIYFSKIFQNENRAGLGKIICNCKMSSTLDTIPHKFIGCNYIFHTSSSGPSINDITSFSWLFDLPTFRQSFA